MSRRRQDQKPGRVRGAGITILHVVTSGAREDDTRYRVRYDCCGAEGEITGHSIYDRRRRNSALCRHCGPKPGRDRRDDRKPGRVPGAGIVITEVLERGKTAVKTRYLALYDCCGKSGEITGHSISERVRNGSRTCASCGNEQRGHNPENVPDYGVTPPEWPVPRQSLVGVHVPFYDRGWAEQLKFGLGKTGEKNAMKKGLLRKSNLVTNNVSGDLSGVWGDLTGVSGDLADCEISIHDRDRVIDVKELIGPSE